MEGSVTINHGAVYMIPQQHNPTQRIVRFDPSYGRSLSGSLKVTECLVSAVGLLCIMVSPCQFSCSSNNWFNFVASTGLMVTLIFLSLYLFHIVEKLKFIPWLVIEILYSGLWGLFYMIAAILISVKVGISDAYIAASFFGFAGAFLYAADCYTKYECRKFGIPAQETHPQQQMSMSTSPMSPNYPTY